MATYEFDLSQGVEWTQALTNQLELNFSISQAVEWVQALANQLELNLSITQTVNWSQQDPHKFATSAIEWSDAAVRTLPETISQGVTFSQSYTVQKVVPTTQGVVFTQAVGLLKVTNLEITHNIVFDGD
jgi:hypothetical protein